MNRNDAGIAGTPGKLSTFPAFFRVAGKRIAVFGSGAAAQAKVRLLANTSAHVTVFAESASAGFHTTSETQAVEFVDGLFHPEQLDGAALVFAATGDAALDRRIAGEARARGIPANAVDQPDACDFFTPALINRAPVAIAIGTEGAGPVLAQIIRARIEALLSPALGDLAALAARYRRVVERLVPHGAARRMFWRQFFTGGPSNAVAEGNLALARRQMTRLLRNDRQATGHVWLVGAGPGAEDLLTLRAQRVMQEAEIILHDALVPQAVVDMGRRDAERIPVGKRKGEHSVSQNEINHLLVSLAKAGKRVVRLKSGDPLVFGRAAEEIEALRNAGVSHAVVPGVTAALAAAADFELPLTQRGVASSLVFTTGHDLAGETLPDWAYLALSGATVAIYMGRTVAVDVTRRLIEAGMAADTPVAVAENAGQRDRRLLYGVLTDLPDLSACNDLTGPVMVIIGAAVAAGNFTEAMPLATTATISAA